MTTLTITRPDDWHVHLRDGEVLKDTVRDISRYNGRALIMPNTVPPVTNTEMALAYRDRILKEQHGEQFEPLMALYLTDNTSASWTFTPSASFASFIVNIHFPASIFLLLLLPPSFLPLPSHLNVDETFGMLSAT